MADNNDDMAERLEELSTHLCHQCIDIYEEIMNLDNKWCDKCRTYLDCEHKEALD